MDYPKRDIQYEGYEAHIDGEFHHGIILEVTEDGLMVRPTAKDFVYSKGHDRYDPYWIAKEDFDKVKLELWDDNWGCDDSAIGLDGCFEPWRHVWDENNLKFSYY